eukprot:9486484-Pyramimonas_sp.AAC.1
MNEQQVLNAFNQLGETLRQQQLAAQQQQQRSDDALAAVAAQSGGAGTCAPGIAGAEQGVPRGRVEGAPQGGAHRHEGGGQAGGIHRQGVRLAGLELQVHHLAQRPVQRRRGDPRVGRRPRQRNHHGGEGAGHRGRASADA